MVRPPKSVTLMPGAGWRSSAGTTPLGADRAAVTRVGSGAVVGSGPAGGREDERGQQGKEGETVTHGADPTGCGYHARPRESPR